MSESSDRQDLGTDEHRPADPVAAGDQPPPAEQEGVPLTTPPAAVADSSGAQAVEEDFDALLADAQRERDEYLDLARRTKADFENYRKRVAADLQTAAVRGKAELAPALLDAVDNLERALEAKGLDPHSDPLDESPEQTSDGFEHGVLLVLNGMRETLRRNGIEAVDPKGEKFDPNQHEALSTMPVEGTESGLVVEVMQKGYRMDDQLIRPARVVVSA